MRIARLLLALSCSLAVAGTASAQTAPRRAYEALRAKELALAAAPTPPLEKLRKQVTAWEGFVRRYPVSGYADDALWAAAELATRVSERSNADADRRLAAQYFRWLAREYPASDKVKPALTRAAALEPGVQGGVPPRTSQTVRTADAAGSPPASSNRATATRGVLPPPPPVAAPARPSTTTDTPSPVGPSATLKDVRRAILPELVRVTIELDDEVSFTHERIEGPARVYFDIKNAGAVPTLQDRVLSFGDDVVKHIRIGRHPNRTTRVVLDLDGVSRYSVFTLYAPYRIVVDLERARGPRAVSPDVTSPTLVEDWSETSPAAGARTAAVLAPTTASPPRPRAADVAAAAPPVVDAIPLKSTSTSPHLDPPPMLAVANEPTGSPVSAPAPAGQSRSVVAATRPEPKPPAVAAPTAPAANATGGFSLARQLGLGVSRVVIDPGHGGHDPGALGKRVNEADLVLDIALRLEKLLTKAGIEVVMTRRTDVFIPLEERTAIANRTGADLFLSIHANASRNVKANGVETYFLNFASNPEAEAVAARENSASGQSMHTLPDIVRAIALNNKLDESRDFARLVQESMVSKLRKQNKQVRDLGVKQAPFVVLIGAGMPSVLAEIAFVTHPQEGQLLRTTAYRQHVADALHDAVNRYVKSLKAVGTVASQD